MTDSLDRPSRVCAPDRHSREEDEPIPTVGEVNEFLRWCRNHAKPGTSDRTIVRLAYALIRAARRCYCREVDNCNLDDGKADSRTAANARTLASMQALVTRLFGPTYAVAESALDLHVTDRQGSEQWIPR